MHGVGHMVGAGIYVLTGTVAKDIAGPGIIVSFLFAGIACLLSALCYAEFGTRVPKAGSAYVYTYISIGEFWAFVIGWNILLEHMIAGGCQNLTYLSFSSPTHGSLCNTRLKACITIAAMSYYVILATELALSHKINPQASKYASQQFKTYQRVIENIKEDIRNKFPWLTVDETNFTSLGEGSGLELANFGRAPSASH
ncbi:hypothetical protein NQ318_010886 [Aromia moschata]|uniref:Amino acid permease/ SLC12A domain-containing protein n=1 Tax=Aromia moschata TaxID=1265417 RepID=A0AAV8XKN1_9CUCU|nr:hypothetical protein NQ318_010886 [Aromia moschata]